MFRKYLPSAETVVAETFSEWIVVDLELSDLFVLIGSNCYERRLIECERIECIPSHTEYVVRLHNMDSWLVFVHRVQNNLLTNTEH
jgi:hypothetical protein